MAMSNIKVKSKSTSTAISELNQLAMDNQVLLRWIPAHKGACSEFLKGVGEESARNVGSEATAASKASCSRVPGAQSPENF